MKQKTMDREASRSCLGETSYRSREVMGNDPILEPKHKIFLSHSGAQKEFVDHLCKALEDHSRYPFFDRRHESKPKGEQFPKLIIRAAKQCEMLIVVVSDEYFMSKWPMIELSAFIQAHKLHHESKSSSEAPKILPLFYGLSMSALDDATLRMKWFRKWESLAEVDLKNQIIVSDWKYALEVLKSFNGLPYDRDLKESVAYQNKVVSYICKSISPDIRWDDSHVQGKSNICQCKHILRGSLFKQRTFLAIDNVSDSYESIKMAKTFLNLPYHVESLVVVTARFQSVLEFLGIKEDACLEMPNLGEEDAMKLFLHHAVGGKELFEDEEMCNIMKCVERCYFFTGYHYHPLALRSLGLQLGCFGEKPSIWVKHLPRKRSLIYLLGKNPVFDILRNGFDLLPKEEQTLFMDVGCFLKTMTFNNLLSSLCIVHENDEDTIVIKLEHLKRKGLLEYVDLRCGQIIMHDLYKEFIELKLEYSTDYRMGPKDSNLQITQIFSDSSDSSNSSD